MVGNDHLLLVYQFAKIHEGGTAAGASVFVANLPAIGGGMKSGR